MVLSTSCFITDAHAEDTARYVLLCPCRSLAECIKAGATSGRWRVKYAGQATSFRC